MSGLSALQPYRFCVRTARPPFREFLMNCSFLQALVREGGFAAEGTMEVSVSCAQRSLNPARKARTRSASRRWSVLSPVATGRWSRPPSKAKVIAMAKAPPISGRRPPRKKAYGPPTSYSSSNLPLLIRCITLTTAPAAPATRAATGAAQLIDSQTAAIPAMTRETVAMPAK